MDHDLKPKANCLKDRIRRLIIEDFAGLFREFRWSCLPPLMVYFAAGISGFTGIIESFFVKENLGLTAAFMANLAFWAGLPWALKMPIGHLVDLFWRRKTIFVYVGAALMAASLLIMVGLTGHTGWMANMLPVDIWYILAAMLSPVGFVLQDAVADAMTVEAVPTATEDGSPMDEKRLQQMHITMQTLGRIAVVTGGAMVAGVGGWLATVLSYATMYLISLSIPLISIIGVLLGAWMTRRRMAGGPSLETTFPGPSNERGRQIQPNWYILAGSAAFVGFSLIFGLSAFPLKEETIFMGSLGIIALLMGQLLRPLNPTKRREIICLAVIIFIFRAMPSIGAGAGWWQIDVLGFDEVFFGTLRQISAILAIVGMFALRGWMARRPIPYLVVFLSVYSFVMMLPFIGMYYGLHEWTETVLGFGPRAIALVDTMADSPLGQVAMIPMLAWIAKEAPRNQKATYFAVMAAFTNLALSASQLGTKYLNGIFVIERGRYDELGGLMTATALITLIVPILAVVLLNTYRTGRFENAFSHLRLQFNKLHL
jgi:MFS family permease